MLRTVGWSFDRFCQFLISKGWQGITDFKVVRLSFWLGIWHAQMTRYIARQFHWHEGPISQPWWIFSAARSILKFSFPIAAHSFNSLCGELSDISIATEHVILIFITWLPNNVSIFPRQIRFISLSLTLGFNHVNCERNGFFLAKPRWKTIFPS